MLTTKDISHALGGRPSKFWPWAALLAGSAAGLAVVAAIRGKRSGRYELRDRVAVVTGGSRGLGFLVAEELARAGCRVVICARDPRELRWRAISWPRTRTSWPSPATSATPATSSACCRAR